GHGVLVGTVVVHGPDFLVSAAAAHEINLDLGDSLNSATEAEDNFVGEFVCGGAGGVAGGGVLILFAQNLRRRDVLHVIKPALNGHAVTGDAQVANGQHRGIRRRRAPSLNL